MKKTIILLLTIAAGFITSCSKEKVDAPDFDATPVATTVKLGDPVTFNLSGNPDYLTFYSGEPGKIGANRNRTVAKGSSQNLIFSTNNSGTQVNSLKLLVSKNFNGKYDAAGIAAATWTDITSRATLAAGATVVSSGAINLTDFNTDDKPLYIAFYYLAPVNTLKPRVWNVTALTVNNVFTDPVTNAVTFTSNVVGNFGVANNFANAGFTAVDLQNDTYKWTVSGTQLNMSAGPIGEPANEDWVISGPLQLNVVPPDPGVVIKAPDAQRLTTYSYTFTKAGTYVISFLAASANRYDRKELYKEYTITVTP